MSRNRTTWQTCWDFLRWKDWANLRQKYRQPARNNENGGFWSWEARDGGYGIPRPSPRKLWLPSTRSAYFLNICPSKFSEYLWRAAGQKMLTPDLVICFNTLYVFHHMIFCLRPALLCNSRLYQLNSHTRTQISSFIQSSTTALRYLAQWT